MCGHSAQVGDGQTVRLSLLSFGGRLSSHGDVDSVESPTKTCYEVGAVQVTDTAQHRAVEMATGNCFQIKILIVCMPGTSRFVLMLVIYAVCM